MNDKCSSCKHWTHDTGRAHQDQCAKFGDIPVWLAFQEPEHCNQGEKREPAE